LRKTFNHQFVKPILLETETIDGQRHYVLPDGLTKLKSVTTLLGEKLDKTALLEWRAKVGEEEANRISTQAARRGTAIHNIAERYLLNESNYAKGEMPVNVESFLPIKSALDNHVDNIRGVELALYSKALGCAGRTDLVAEFDGKLSIIDFKTSRKEKKEDWIESYFLQSTIYSMMFQRLYGMEVTQVAIIITVDHEKKPQVFVKDRGLYVNRVIEVLKG
jgi:ATP-dependent exoDNAse (exonuclease V) beta subunit